MNNVMIEAIVIPVVIIGIVYSIAAYLYHKESRGEQKLSYTAVRRLSAIAPDKWDFDPDWEYCKYHPTNLYDDYTNIYMKTFFEYILLWKYSRQIDLEYKNARTKKQMERLVVHWEKDIDDYNTQSEQEIEEMKQRISADVLL